MSNASTIPPAPITTEQRRLVPTLGPQYRKIEVAMGESHGCRRELLGGLAQQSAVADANSTRLAGLIHFTDFQYADLASPSRADFLQRTTGNPRWQKMLPAYRPQEFLLPQAIEAMTRSMNAFVQADPRTWHVGLTTGDNTDTAQRNELDAYLTALDGGTVLPAGDTRNLADAPVGLGDPAYWNPEPHSDDDYKRNHGLPTVPGAVAAATQPFATEGLGLPWLTCFGNHDCLVQGRAAEPTDYVDFLTGTAKPVAVDEATAPRGNVYDAYIQDPRWTMHGRSVPIESVANRRMISKQEYIAAHVDAAGSPNGHGFTVANVESGLAYYAYDITPSVRILVLDTTNMAGDVNGCIDEAQWQWLEQQLVACHSAYNDVAGQRVETGNTDRVVLVASHHGLSTLNNDFAGPSAVAERDSNRRYLAQDAEAMLHRFPNVALWLSGHTHVNRITPRPNKLAGGGFWEVSTSAIAEWPVQWRTLELFFDAGCLRIRTTMMDTVAPANHDGRLDVAGLASLHREVAANDPGSVGGFHAEGEPSDRNQDLWVPISPELAATLGG